MRRGEWQGPQQERESDFAQPVGTAAKDVPVMLNNVSPQGGAVCRAAAEDRLPDRANMAATPNALSPEDRPLRAKLGKSLFNPPLKSFVKSTHHPEIKLHPKVTAL